MKIAILGNSHVGALRRGWDNIKNDHSDIELTFFAAARDTLNSLELEDTSLVTKVPKTIKVLQLTSGGKDRIEIPEYDAYLVYSMRSRPVFLGKSEPVSEDFLSEYYKEKTFFNIISKIRQITDKKIYLGHDPLLAKSYEEIESQLGVDTDTEGEQMYNKAMCFVQDTVEELGNVELIRQPKTTMVRNCATIMEYTQGSERLRVDSNTKNLDNAFHSDNDRTHMNNSYGEIYLKNFFDLLAA